VKRYSENEKQRLLLQAEYLENRDRDVDEKHRAAIERGGLWTQEDAARWVFNDHTTDADRVIERLRILLEFLLFPRAELASVDFEFLEFRNQLYPPVNYQLASLLRIYTPGVWHAQWYDELGRYVGSKWEEAKFEDGRSVKVSWEQRRPKGTPRRNSLANQHFQSAAENFFKKELKPQSSDPERKKRKPGGQKRNPEGKFRRPEDKSIDPGEF
jgi:hypothetical protein